MESKFKQESYIHIQYGSQTWVELKERLSILADKIREEDQVFSEIRAISNKTAGLVEPYFDRKYSPYRWAEEQEKKNLSKAAKKLISEWKREHPGRWSRDVGDTSYTLFDEFRQHSLHMGCNTWNPTSDLGKKVEIVRWSDIFESSKTDLYLTMEDYRVLQTEDLAFFIILFREKRDQYTKIYESWLR